MSKKQQIILLHGTGQATSNDQLGLVQGEIAVRNASSKEDSTIYSLTSGGELVEFPSKTFVNKAITDLNVGGQVDAIKERLTNLEAADTAIRGEFAAADTALENRVTSGYTDAINVVNVALQGEIDTIEGEIDGIDAKLETIDSDLTDLKKIRGEFAAADEAITSAYTAADAAITSAYTAADKAIEEAYKSADSALQTAIDGKVAQTAYDTKIGEIEGDITNLEKVLSGYTDEGSVKAAVDSKVAQTAYDTKIGEIEGSISAIEKTISELDDTYATDDQLSGAVSTLEGKIAAAQTAATTKVVEGTDAGNNLSIVETTGETGNTYTINLTDVASAQGLSAANEKIATLVGTVEGDDEKSVRTIASELVAAVVDEAPAAFDTLKEIANWIGSGDEISGTTAAQMLIDIKQNKTDIATEKQRAEGVESGLNTRLGIVEGDYLKNADKTELSGLITAEENRATSAETALGNRIKTIEDDYLVEADKDALSGLISALDTRVGTNETNISNLSTGLTSNVERLESLITANTVVVDENSDFIVVTPTVDNTTGTTYTITTNDIASASALSGVNTRLSTAEGTITELVTFKNTTVPNTYATLAQLQVVTDDYLKAADKTELETKITNEETRAKGAESGLDTRLTTVEGNYVKTITSYKMVEGVLSEVTEAATGNNINLTNVVINGGTYEINA